MDNAQYIWNYLKERGFNDYGCAGLMGNLYAESGLNPQNLQNSYEKSLGMTDAQYTAAVDNGTYKNFGDDKAGYGLAQWTYHSRKKNLFNFCKQKGKSIGDLQTQLDFLYWELTTSYPQVVQVLKTATSVLAASNSVLLDFERPKLKDELSTQTKRASYSQGYFNKYAAKSTGGITGMKYSNTNKPLVCMQTQSTCYKGTRKMEIKGVLWHSTGANNPWLKRYVQPSDNAADRAQMLSIIGTNANKNDWNHIERQAGLNCWIGKLADGTVATVQTMPWDYRPWGCGSGSKGSCNTGWIQFEICEDGLTDANYFAQVYREACEITAYLCKLYNIDPHGTVNVNGTNVPTILCHADSYKLGFGSNHGDINHWFPKFGKSMATARDDVATLMGSSSAPVTPTVPTTPTMSYQVSVTANDGLNCRTVGSTAGKIVKTYPFGTILTISKESNNWGYTGEGWVSLAYTKKLIEEDDDMTQEKFNEMMNNYINSLADKPATFEQEALTWAQQNGIMAGDEKGRLMPKKYSTRGEFIVMLYRFAKKYLKV